MSRGRPKKSFDKIGNYFLNCFHAGKKLWLCKKFFGLRNESLNFRRLSTRASFFPIVIILFPFWFNWFELSSFVFDHWTVPAAVISQLSGGSVLNKRTDEPRFLSRTISRLSPTRFSRKMIRKFGTALRGKHLVLNYEIMNSEILLEGSYTIQCGSRENFPY